MDFMNDQLADGRQLCIIQVIDDFNREPGLIIGLRTFVASQNGYRSLEQI